MCVCAHVRACVRACVHACVYKTHIHVFSGGIDESCIREDQCEGPMKCLNGKCQCPPNTHYVSDDVIKAFYNFRCVSNNGKFPLLIQIWNNHV